MYKLNLHAHSNYSDGAHTVSMMAMQYKSLGFPCCVITDHVYSSDAHYSNNLDKYFKQIEEADRASKEHDIPVILGAEFSVSRSEECLVFGKNAIISLLLLRAERQEMDRLDGVITYRDLIDAKKYNPCAVILCHPMLSETSSGILQLNGHLALDGFERINSCNDFFAEERREVPKEFEGLPSFCNSDAHSLFCLNDCYNLTEEPVTSEEQLIAYIKNRRPIKHVVFEEPTGLKSLILP